MRNYKQYFLEAIEEYYEIMKEASPNSTFVQSYSDKNKLESGLYCLDRNSLNIIVFMKFSEDFLKELKK